VTVSAAIFYVIIILFGSTYEMSECTLFRIRGRACSSSFSSHLASGSPKMFRKIFTGPNPA
jgi:hypothetical protein